MTPPARPVERCEHGIDRSRVYCPPCGPERLAPSALEDTVSAGDGPVCRNVDECGRGRRMHDGGGVWVCRSCGSTVAKVVDGVEHAADCAYRARLYPGCDCGASL